MKIGIDISTLLDRYYSGVSEYAHNLICELVRLDKNNEYVLYYNSFKDPDLKLNFASDNIKICRTEYPNRIFNYGLEKVLRLPKIDKLIGGADIFFSPHLNFYAFSSACYKIITIHDVSFLRYPEFFSIRKNLWHRAINIKKLLKQYDKIIAVSENTKNDLREMCAVPEAKIEVIYSGIDNNLRPIDINDTFEQQQCKKIKQKYKLPEKFIFYLGNIEPRKNIEAIISAFDLLLEKDKNYAEYNLVIAGAKCWKSKSILEKWEKSSNKNKIIFLGYVEKADKKYLYNSAEIFIYPSFYEGFGFPPLEALACACPVIISGNSSLAEIAGNHAIIVNPYNTVEIAKTIKQVLNNRDYYKKKLINAFALKANYSWEKTASQYLRLFYHANNRKKIIVKK